MSPFRVCSSAAKTAWTPHRSWPDCWATVTEEWLVGSRVCVTGGGVVVTGWGSLVVTGLTLCSGYARIHISNGPESLLSRNHLSLRLLPLSSGSYYTGLCLRLSVFSSSEIHVCLLMGLLPTIHRLCPSGNVIVWPLLHQNGVRCGEDFSISKRVDGL
ncbi:hypothetical protein Tco_1517706 [Tanacetum coccineum]